MMNRGNSSQYVSSEEEIKDGCQNFFNLLLINQIKFYRKNNLLFIIFFCFAGNISQLKITLSFTNTSEEYCNNEIMKGNMEILSLYSVINQSINQSSYLSIYIYLSNSVDLSVYLSRERKR